MKYASLFKRTENKKISQWIIETKPGGYRTESGYVDGVRSISEWYPVEATNVGRSNQRDAYAQACFVAEKIIKDKKKIGWVESVDAIDSVEVEHFQPMLAAKWEDVKAKIEYPVMVQPKLDGIRCIAKADGLWTRNGKQIVSCPHIEAALASTFENNPSLILDGELYNHSLKEDFNTITSIVKKLKPSVEDVEKSKAMIQYWVYDVASSNLNFENRTMVLQHVMVIPIDYVHFVDTKVVVNEASVDAAHELFVGFGFEGAMVRIMKSKYENKRSKSLLKMKTFSDDEFKIVGYVEGKASRAACLQSFICEAHNGETFQANANFPVDQLKKWWLQKDALVGKTCTVKYFSISEYGIPRFPKVTSIRDYE